MRKLLLIFGVSILIFSCAEEIDDNEQNKQQVEKELDKNDDEVLIKFPDSSDELNGLLSNSTSKVWGDATFQVFGVGVQACRNDDTIELFSDGSYKYDNGAILCGMDVQNQNGIWEINFEEKTIVFDKGTDKEYTAQIKSISQDKLIVEGKWSGLSLTGEFKGI